MSDCSPITMIGESAGFTSLYDGFAGRFAGRYERAALIPASTSRAAPLISRLRSNCIVTLVVPSELDDVISVMPAICANCRSSGVATDDAIMSGLAPGSPAATLIVGKSTCGSGDTGSTINEIMPAIANAIVSSVVATGRSMNTREGFMPDSLPAVRPSLVAPASSPSVWRIAVPDYRRRYKSPASYTASAPG